MRERSMLAVAVAVGMAACGSSTAEVPAFAEAPRTGVSEAPSGEVAPEADRGCIEGALAERFGLDLEQRILFGVELEPGPPTIMRYSRTLGDGGGESCRAQYDTARALTELSCDYRYVSHSMGPANADTRMEVRRAYDGGELTDVSGSVVQWNAATGRTTRRALTSLDDDALELLERPLLQIPDACVRLTAAGPGEEASSPR